jgi:hypothetical protein
MSGVLGPGRHPRAEPSHTPDNGNTDDGVSSKINDERHTRQEPIDQRLEPEPDRNRTEPELTTVPHASRPTVRAVGVASETPRVEIEPLVTASGPKPAVASFLRSPLVARSVASLSRHRVRSYDLVFNTQDPVITQRGRGLRPNFFGDCTCTRARRYGSSGSISRHVIRS